MDETMIFQWKMILLPLAAFFYIEEVNQRDCRAGRRGRLHFAAGFRVSPTLLSDGSGPQGYPRATTCHSSL